MEEEGGAACAAAVASSGSGGQPWDALDERRAALAAEADKLLQEAEALFDRDQLEDAARAALAALTAFRELGGQEASAAAALRLVLAVARLQGGGDPGSGAEALARQALERAAHQGDRHAEAVALLALLELNRDRHGQSDAQSVLRGGERAQALFQELGNRRMVGEALLGQCDVHFRHGQAEGLLRTANAALSVFRSLQDRKGEGRCLHSIGVACALQRKPTEALKCALAARFIFQQVRAPRLEALGLQAVAQAYQMLKDHRQALRHAQEALALHRELAGPGDAGRAAWGGLFAEAAAASLVADAHVALGEASDALRVSEEALARYQAADCKAEQLMALDSVVSALLAQKELQRALRRAEEGADLARELADATWEASMLQAQAGILLQQGNHDGAIRVAEDAIGILQELGDLPGEASALLGAVAGAHLAAGRHDQALAAAREARALYKEAGDRRGEASALLVASRVHQAAGRMQDAEQAAKDGRQAAKEASDGALELQALQALVALHIAAGHPEEGAQVAYQGHVLSQRERDKKAEVNMLLLQVQALFACMQQYIQKGGTRPSRDFDGLWSRAEKAALTSSRLVGTLGDRELQGHVAYALAEVQLVGTRFKDALQGADEAIQLYRAGGLKTPEGSALLLRGQALLHLGRHDEALDAAEEGLAIARACDDPRLLNVAEGLIAAIRGGPRLQEQPRPRAPQEPQDGGAQGLFAKQVEGAAPAAAAPVEEEKRRSLDPTLVHDTLHTMLREMMGVEVETDTPFMDAGVDSLMSIEFRAQVNQAFEGLTLSNTLTFDYPTVRELTAHVVERSGG